ncbi:hypothetical protein ACFC08_28445 [Streptomyces sp. NPDC056112]|uniref:hypothetical protein n=1 Tax=Streptomyces sp. NPDC056112 TaxID=3345715 RepID=UPI0035DEDA78
MPAFPTDWLLLAALVLVLAVSAIGTSLLWSRGRARRRAGLPSPGSYPGSRQQAVDLNLSWWRNLPTGQQAAIDAVALAEAGAEDAARLTAERARINALYRP